MKFDEMYEKGKVMTFKQAMAINAEHLVILVGEPHYNMSFVYVLRSVKKTWLHKHQYIVLDKLNSYGRVDQLLLYESEFDNQNFKRLTLRPHQHQTKKVTK